MHASLPESFSPVHGDEAGFELALRQLLENAVKFTQAGAVTLAAEEAEGTLRFLVSDTGTGIPEAHRDKVFEPFHQVDAGDPREVTGLGIGLTLARQALERMGGTLCLETSGPEGSCFSLELPLEAPTPPSP